MTHRNDTNWENSPKHGMAKISRELRRTDVLSETDVCLLAEGAENYCLQEIATRILIKVGFVIQKQTRVSQHHTWR